MIKCNNEMYITVYNVSDIIIWHSYFYNISQGSPSIYLLSPVLLLWDTNGVVHMKVYPLWFIT